MKRLILISLLLAIATSSFSQRREKREYEYRDTFAATYIGEKTLQDEGTMVMGADEYITEFVLDDKTRVDILTKEYAIEVDFADNWYNGVGQSLHYALKTDKKPAMVIIVENPVRDERHITRLQQVAVKYGITVYFVDRNHRASILEHKTEFSTKTLIVE